MSADASWPNHAHNGDADFSILSYMSLCWYRFLYDTRGDKSCTKIEARLLCDHVCRNNHFPFLFRIWCISSFQYTSKGAGGRIGSLNHSPAFMGLMTSGHASTSKMVTAFRSLSLSMCFPAYSGLFSLPVRVAYRKYPANATSPAPI
jgi:hypothetical protein